ncbi:helix-turn-helix domain-containing protein [Tundrisphaera sp. TA3]|uniref:helix-turn-helix domain-containing protein n=1 Tax=Tundrisphaera sp. TA3 TaxID=3435775 RepID=UPI003EBFA774
MTIKEFAERAEISQRLAYELVSAGVIAHRRVGGPGNRGTIRISDADFDAWVETTKVPARTPVKSGSNLGTDRRKMAANLGKNSDKCAMHNPYKDSRLGGKYKNPAPPRGKVYIRTRCPVMDLHLGRVWQ